MPFERLETDEPISPDAASTKARDFEGTLMTGCGVILVSSVLTYLMSFWPFAAVPHHTVSGLVQALALASLPTWVFGAILARKFGMAGASGFVGGALCSAIFIYLRLQMVTSVRGDRTLPQPEYPDRWAVIIPVAWLLASAAAMMLFLPSWFDKDEGEPATDRES